MPLVAVITDSAACIPQALLEEYAIEVVPHSLSFDGEALADGVSFSSDEFYQRLQAARRPPTTMTAPPGAFLDAFRRARERAQAALCVTIGSRFSGAFDAACQGARLAEEEAPTVPVRVLDSGNASMAQGFVVLAAARAASAGASLEEAVARAEQVIPLSRLIGVLDTLDYVARSGRVPRAAALAATLLQIKPILQYYRGEYQLLERPRTKPRAVARMLELASLHIAPTEKLHMSVIHTHVPEEAADLAQKVEALFHPYELYITDSTAVMAAHTGPGLIGLAFYCGE